MKMSPAAQVTSTSEHCCAPNRFDYLVYGLLHLSFSRLQFSVSSLTTTTSAESSSSAGLVSTSWPLANDSHEQEHSHRSSQSLGTPSPSNVHQQSNTILKEILSYPWSYEASNSGHDLAELDKNPLDSVRTASVVSDEFQPDFYYLCPLKNTTSFVQTDEKLNGIPRQYSHDV